MFENPQLVYSTAHLSSLITKKELLCQLIRSEKEIWKLVYSLQAVCYVWEYMYMQFVAFVSSLQAVCYIWEAPQFLAFISNYVYLHQFFPYINKVCI